MKKVRHAEIILPYQQCEIVPRMTFDNNIASPGQEMLAEQSGVRPIRVVGLGSKRQAAPELYFAIAGANIRVLQSLQEAIYV